MAQLAWLCLALARGVEAQAPALDASVFGGAAIPATYLGRTPGGATLSQAVTPVAGLRITAWWSAIGWDAAFVYGPGSVESDAGGSGAVCAPAAGCDVSVWYMSSRLLARWQPRDGGRLTLFGGGGLVVAGHDGDFLDHRGALTDLGFTLGAGALLRLSRAFALRFDVEDHIYAFRPAKDDEPIAPFDGTERTQHDVVLSVGLSWRLFGREP